MGKLVTGNMGKRLMQRFFRPVKGVVWDLMTGRVGVRTESGIVTLEGEGDAAELVSNMFDEFGMELPAFAQSTPVEEIKTGDLIYGERGPIGWVIGLPAPEAKDFTLLKPSGDHGPWRPPKVKSLGLDLSGVMVLRSLINTLPDGGLGDMQSMLLPMLRMGGDDIGLGDVGEILPMLLMTKTGILGKSEGMSGMLQTMLMMKMVKKNDRPDGPLPRDRGRSYFD
ncbi:MAG: hypothetical protein ACI8W8_003649 [Rhodothermales bacterium]|jgi:hypothetical protein